MTVPQDCRAGSMFRASEATRAMKITKRDGGTGNNGLFCKWRIQILRSPSIGKLDWFINNVTCNQDFFSFRGRAKFPSSPKEKGKKEEGRRNAWWQVRANEALSTHFHTTSLTLTPPQSSSFGLKLEGGRGRVSSGPCPGSATGLGRSWKL